MNLLLDNIVFELQPVGGISAVWRAVLDAVVADPELDAGVVDTGRGRGNLMYPKGLDGVRVVEDRRMPLCVRRYLDVAGHLDAGVFHSSYFRVHKGRNIANVVTVHDFVYERFGSGPSRWVHLRQKRRALARAAAIICVSHNTKDDLLHFHPGIDPSRVHVVYNGVSDEFRPLPDAGPRTGRPYLLWVGTRARHKDFPTALSLLATPTATALDLDLVVAGGRPLSASEKRAIADAGLEQRIRSCGRTDTPALNRLYNGAFALFYPSLYEGFGIPPLEALAAGCPVLCTSVSSLPEVLGDAASFFPPGDVESAEHELTNLEANGTRARLVERGLARAAELSWERTGRQTLAVYRRLLGRDR